MHEKPSFHRKNLNWGAMQGSALGMTMVSPGAPEHRGKLLSWLSWTIRTLNECEEYGNAFQTLPKEVAEKKFVEEWCTDLQQVP